MWQAFLTAVTKLARIALLPMAEPPTVPGQTGATSEPMARRCGGDFVGHGADGVFEASGRCAGERERDRYRRTVGRRLRRDCHLEHAIEMIGGWSAPGLCRRGRATWRCEFGERCVWKRSWRVSCVSANCRFVE